MLNRVVVLIAVALSAGAVPGQAEETASAVRPENSVKHGHSYHGEAFDEGPRQAAALLGSTGRVSFPITSKSADAQAFFNQGIGQLHGFWYYEAERSFRQVCLLDHDCAIAYWGMALANVNNDRRAKGFLADAVKRKDSASERERMYIDALDAWYKAEAGDEKKKKSRAQNYVNALENIVHKFPDDVEARALLGLALWQNRSDLSITSYFAIDALMNTVLASNPMHPVHHYRIHLWDNDKSPQAVNSAERCGLSAPGIAHMWHMSGHTYSKLKQYFDASWHQEASTRTDHAYMMRDRIFPDAIHNFAHNNEWLVQNMRHLGRVHDAVALSRNTIELPRHPKFNSFPNGGKSAHYGRLHLYETYSQFELWDALIADAGTQYLGPTEDHTELVKHLRLLGRAYFRKGDVALGQSKLESLQRRLKRLKQETEDAVEKAAARARFDGKDAKGVEAAQSQARQPNNEKIRVLERAVDELQGYALLHEGKPTEALDRLKKATGLADEYLADVQYQAGKKEEAWKSLRSLVDSNKNEVLPLAALIQMEWKLGKKDEARQSFEKLREISGAVDLDVPPFERLQPIAVELGFGQDWRKPRPIASNAADLPDLASLGPIHWQPVPASDFSLPDADGKLRTLAQFHGRPVIVIFYLGYGCLHCIEQLQAFAPKTAEFEKAGISLIAISTDSLDDLKKSHERYKGGVFPFPLVSDDNSVVFKQFRVFDDFEKVPLHGTFLIDAEGRIRWHDVGAEPFMNVDFLIKESRRLLSPNLIDEVIDPIPLDDNRPADALDPLNIFPAPAPAPAASPAPMPTPPVKASVTGG